MNVYIIGDGKFALEVSNFVQEYCAGNKYSFAGFISIEDDKDSNDIEVVNGHTFNDKNGYVIGVSDMEIRNKLLEKYRPNEVNYINIVHKNSSMDKSVSLGVGNIIGPSNYIGVNVSIGDFNVINYMCSIGHHSRIGSGNFLAPNFHSGNSIKIGNNNLFGVGCVMSPQTVVGDRNKFSIGTLIEGVIENDYLCFNTSRLKVTQI
jgi:acetyltransferase-like isoleucine patch superfamily enzyme